METLPRPEVLRRFTDAECQPPLPAMRLRWDPTAMGFGERLWYLPENVCLTGPAPERFGVTIDRHGDDSYCVHVLWNRTYLSWPDVTRVQLLTSALAPLLAALGTDLWQLLSEPVRGTLRMPRVAA
jgi:hypothetical protein